MVNLLALPLRTSTPNCFAMKLCVAVICLSTIHCKIAQAAIISIDFTGHVVDVVSANPALGYVVGAPITGRVSYSTDWLLSGPPPVFSVGVQPPLPDEAVTLNGIPYFSTPAIASGILLATDNVIGVPPGEYIAIGAFGGAGQTLAEFSLQFFDPTNSLFPPGSPSLSALISAGYSRLQLKPGLPR